MKTEKTHTEANRQAWDRRFAANRSPLYKKNANKRAWKATGNKHREDNAKSIEENYGLPQAAYKKAGVAIYIFTHK